MAFRDVDDTIRHVYGHAKQGAASGYSGVRGLNAQLAVLSTPVAAPVIAAARLRKGNTASHKGGGQLLAAQAIKTTRRAGAEFAGEGTWLGAFDLAISERRVFWCDDRSL